MQAAPSAIPGDPRDTSTSLAMMDSLRKLALGDALAAPQQEQLQRWLRGNTTGAARVADGIQLIRSMPLDTAVRMMLSNSCRSAFIASAHNH